MLLAACGNSSTKASPCKSAKGSGHYRYVDEVDPKDKCLKSRDVRVAGTLVEGSHQVRSKAGKQEHRFELAHGGKKLSVRYHGPFPAQARPGRKAVVKGRFRQGSFVATEVIVK